MIDEDEHEDENDDKNEDETRSGRRRWNSTAIIGVLTLLLGFAIAVQVRANASSDALSALRDDDLIGILDNQNDRADRLRRQIAQLQENLRQLQNSGDQAAAARRQVLDQTRALGILLGTLPATGPGVQVTVTDPHGRLDGEDLLDVVEELRGAGAEAIAIDGRRIGTDSAFQGAGRSVTLDNQAITAPYTVLAIGEPKTLDTALNIPGGVAALVRTATGSLTVREQSTVTITATRALPPAKYARPTR